ncbi:alpha-hydroxy-acid oxidizing enzyme [Dictyobacter alpinus]|uniref:Alpha-hydroxy-acid oxidizing enzyme n=1 Tax=Dictyobacter alpinus TaxID=2014873 RepID=A0A402B5E5_9CHLR|nr:alpha-hydroxy acid oxidase [Dictyobacter alpinus]GCE26569.1 alpha-hydroxy-acid oxidizing enzyme [Dictyobacter alpinus]
MDPINVFEYEALAKQLMDPVYWDYYAGGSDDEVTLQVNRTDFNRIRLRPRMLVDVSHCDTRTTVLGQLIEMPIMVAPTALHGLGHTEGEYATAQGAGAAGTLMTASTESTRTLEEIAQAASGPLWFQLYIFHSLKLAAELVRRAEAAGYQAIVVTVDLPILGNRERSKRHTISIPLSALKEMVTGVEEEELRREPMTWETIDWLRSITHLPILLKGILTAEDAVLALEHGVDGIIVSNHGGRQLDGAVSSIEALPEIVEAVGGRCEVYMDGGIRRGTDVLKALALGARAVLVGRPILWGLAVDGSKGVQQVLKILQTELERAMKLAGCPTVASINRALVKWT